MRSFSAALAVVLALAVPATGQDEPTPGSQPASQPAESEAAQAWQALERQLATLVPSPETRVVVFAQRRELVAAFIGAWEARRDEDEVLFFLGRAQQTLAGCQEQPAARKAAMERAPALFEAYLARSPQGPRAAEARLQLELARTYIKGLERSMEAQARRAALVGRPLPALGPHVVLISGDPPLEEVTPEKLRGRTVVLCFHATWHNQGWPLLRALDAAAREARERGLIVVYVTRPYGRGHVPVGDEGWETRGSAAQPLDLEGEQACIREHAQKLGLSGTVVLASESWERFHMGGLPQLVVAGPDGTVTQLRAGDLAVEDVPAFMEALLPRDESGERP